MNTILRDFQRLCENAKEISQTTYGTGELEPYLVKILEFTKNHSDEKGELVSAFLGLVRDRTYPVEIIAFCMRELQWHEIKDAVAAIIKNSHDFREQRALEDILDVYEEIWDDTDLYEYYS